MRTSFARLVTSAVCLLAFTLTVDAQFPAPSPAKPLGSVSGRITIKDKGAAGVMVLLRRSEMYGSFEAPLRAVSDPEGNYRIADVSPGPYDLYVNALAYVHTSPANARGRSVVIGEGENIENVDFALVRGGVITGKVTDADGRPLIQYEVKLFRENPDAGQQANYESPITTGTTDDRGVYRTYGLLAGRYKVAAGRGENAAVTGNIGDQAVFKEVYYPDATEPAKATIVEVREGGEATNIDIQLGRPIQTFSVTGRTVDSEKGEPLPNVRLALQKFVGDRIESRASFVVSNLSGNFTLEGLEPGKYTLVTMPDPTSSLRSEPGSFDVIDSDVTGVRVRIGRGASISGVVHLENDNREIFSRLMKLQVMGYVTNPGSNSGVANLGRTTIGPDGSFQIGGLPGGTATIRLTALGDLSLMKGFVITRVERDGLIQTKGIELRDGEQVTGVRLVVGFGSGTLRGVVNIQNGTLPPDSFIMVRLTKAGDQNPTVSSARADNRGRFVIENLPAGSYDVWAFVTGTKAFPPNKQMVVLQDGASAEVTITVDLAENAKP